MNLENLMPLILISAIGLIIFYFLIYTAFKDAIGRKIEPYLKLQSQTLIHLAKQAGMSQEDIDKIILAPHQFKKKYPIK